MVFLLFKNFLLNKIENIKGRAVVEQKIVKVKREFLGVKNAATVMLVLGGSWV